ncbi:MAG: hypothetical protein QOJ60_1531 [Actinomycetota bacterium]|jgi:hypothetical protein|nr:hypothetical protein [Actinomycetota bacterium]
MKWRLFGGLSAVLGGIAARKILVAAWQKSTGKEPPMNPASPTTSWPEAIGWALASGAAMGVARMLATRKAAGYYQRSAGHLPPGMEEVT